MFAIDVTTCPFCGGNLRVIADVTDPDIWLSGHDNICLSSDAFTPFRDNMADEHRMVMFHTGYRWFQH